MKNQLATSPIIINTRPKVYDNGADWLTNAVIRQAAGGFLFTEGAVWHPGGFFLFSDTPANKIYKLSLNGNIDMYLDKSGLTNIAGNHLSDQTGSNGLAIDREGNLLICQHGNHGIAKVTAGGERRIIVDQYNGKPFNSPNDLVIAPDGAIFFTDPPYGLSGQVLHTRHFQPVAGIYKFSSDGIQLISAEMKYPNGLVFSADKKHLLVSSNHKDDPGIVRYRVDAHGEAAYDGIFLKQCADGMTMGPDGNFYLATDDGVLVVSPAAKTMAVLPLPETPSNCCWGGPALEILMVTARSAIYCITH